MLEIRHSEREGIEVSGTVAELATVSQAVSALARAGGAQVSFEARRAYDPSPYDRLLTRLAIAVSPTPVKVSLAGAEEMRVEGTPESLEAFASYFDFEPDAAAGTHIHFEYHESEGNRWVAPGSMPLVVSVR